MVYYISDLHIGHENVIRFDNRPFISVRDMDNALVSNWNARVLPCDTVYILGDFIWAKENEWAEQVKKFHGKKVLIRGNHDPKQFSSSVKKLFQEITDFKEIKDNGRRVILCHYPIPFFNSDFSLNSYMLYGHVHNTIEQEYLFKLRSEITTASKENAAPNGNFINVGVMMPWMGYTPKTLDEIVEEEREYRKLIEMYETE